MLNALDTTFGTFRLCHQDTSFLTIRLTAANRTDARAIELDIVLFAAGRFVMRCNVEMDPGLFEAHPVCLHDLLELAPRPAQPTVDCGHRLPTRRDLTRPLCA